VPLRSPTADLQQEARSSPRSSPRASPPTVDDGAAAAAVSKPNHRQLSEEDIKRKAKSLVDEYIESGDLKVCRSSLELWLMTECLTGGLIGCSMNDTRGLYHQNIMKSGDG